MFMQHSKAIICRHECNGTQGSGQTAKLLSAKLQEYTCNGLGFERTLLSMLFQWWALHGSLETICVKVTTGQPHSLLFQITNDHSWTYRGAVCVTWLSIAYAKASSHI